MDLLQNKKVKKKQNSYVPQRVQKISLHYCNRGEEKLMVVIICEPGRVK